MPIDLTATNRIGRTSLHVTRLGLGTGPLGGWPTAVPRAQALATIERAWEIGIRYFDTAPFYGHGLSEEHLGSLLPGLPRSEFAISTKVGRILEPGVPGDALFLGIPPRVPVVDFSYAGTVRSLTESLERLELDAVDIALIHDPDDHHEQALAEAYEALADLRSRGSISAVGVGMNWTEPLTRFVLERDFDCMLVAGRYTLLEQDSLDDLLPAARERHVSLVAGGVYNSGLLVTPGPNSTYNYEPAPPDLIARALELERTCAAFDVPLRAAALQFALSHPVIATVIVGARTPEEVDDNARMLDLAIPAELWVRLKERELIRDDAPTPA
jgi:D-threo-aldose 1-dehydrogenase